MGGVQTEGTHRHTHTHTFFNIGVKKRSYLGIITHLSGIITHLHSYLSMLFALFFLFFKYMKQ